MKDLNMSLEDFLNEVAKAIVKQLKTRDYNSLSLEAQTLLDAYSENNFSAFNFQEESKLLLKHILFREEIEEDIYISIYDNAEFLEEISTLSKNTKMKEILISHCKRLIA